MQTRLIVTVVSIVSLILIAIGLATGAILRTMMDESLTAQVKATAATVHVGPVSTAEDVLAGSWQEPGTLLIIGGLSTTTGAYVNADREVVPLSDADVADILARVTHDGISTIPVPGTGDHRVLVESRPGFFAMVGLPTSELTKMVGQIITTVALLTVGGLLVLAAVIALVIRHSLRPLHAVADTATRVAALPMAEGSVSIAERVPADEADDRTEIGRVGAALNTLLDHVDTSLAARQRNEERMRAFVADASHELRTPLASIRGYSELSLRAMAHTDAATAADTTEQSLERIQAQSLRMSALVEDLLLLARLDEGTELVYSSVDLTRLTIDAVADARAAGPDHEWALDVGDEPVVVAGDSARLQQVVTNLLANARVHTPAGTHVSATVTLDAGQAVVRVHDDGPGIAPAIADSLFERFTRADASRARKTGGTGLGLSIAQAIVSGHHGAISVESTPGSTTFEVRLPARPPEPAPGAEAQ
nr:MULTISPECIES: ATP-binding protein [Microbacterium]